MLTRVKSAVANFMGGIMAGSSGSEHSGCGCGGSDLPLRFPYGRRSSCGCLRTRWSAAPTTSPAPSSTPRRPGGFPGLLAMQNMASHPPIPILELADHIERLKVNDNLKFSQEYEFTEYTEL